MVGAGGEREGVKRMIKGGGGCDGWENEEGANGGGGGVKKV